MSQFHVLIVGGGGTGGAIAHDLTLRGIKVTLVERGEVTSGTTGRHHGLLHSGARYVVSDPQSARECIQENQLLRKIAPGTFEENDGLFVAVTEEDEAYSHQFFDGCEACGIPVRRLTREQALRLEPNLNPRLILAGQVPDASFCALRLPLRFFATAIKSGAAVKPYTEVVDVLKSGRSVSGVRVIDHRSEEKYVIGADLVINAAGAWSGQIAALADVDVPIRPSPGVMLALRGRLVQMVINRMTLSGDGDIIVPQRELSVVGTSSWFVDDPDDLVVPEEHVQLMIKEGSQMIPAVRQAPFRAAWAASRPLIGARDGDDSRELPRTFKCFDHAEEGVEGFVTVAGGKATTLREMAEGTADVVARKLGIDEPCRTREVVLLPYIAYYN